MTVDTTPRLDEIAKIRAGGTLKLSGKHFVAAGVPAFGAGGLNGYVTTTEYEGPAIILSSIGARCGKCFYVDGAWTSLANTQVILPDPERVDAKFLWYQLNDEQRWHRSGTAQPFIKPSDVKKSRVLLPSLAKQRRIAEVLDRADALRTKRRTAIAGLDTLAGNLFRAMFEGPDRCDWQVAAMDTLIVASKIGLVRGSDLLRDDLPLRYVRMNAITTNGDLDLAGLSRTDASDMEVRDFALQPGDLLFNTRNTRELVGKTAIFRGSPFIHLFNNNIMRIRFSPDVNAEYVHHYLRTNAGRAELEARKAGTTSVFAVYAKSLATVPVPVPPIALQAAFSERVDKIEGSKVLLVSQTEGLARLFKSLQQRAFAGQL